MVPVVPIMPVMPVAPIVPEMKAPQTRDPRDKNLIHPGVPAHLKDIHDRIPPKLREPNFRSRLTKELTEPAVTNPNDIRSFITNLPCHDVQMDDWWFW
jgi:hypothetical protein